jgi:hypothetical protein
MFIIATDQEKQKLISIIDLMLACELKDIDVKKDRLVLSIEKLEKEKELSLDHIQQENFTRFSIAVEKIQEKYRNSEISKKEADEMLDETEKKMSADYDENVKVCLQYFEEKIKEKKCEIDLVIQEIINKADKNFEDSKKFVHLITTITSEAKCSEEKSIETSDKTKEISNKTKSKKNKKNKKKTKNNIN